MGIRTSVGEAVRRSRSARGLSQQNLAERAQISVTHLSNIERGMTWPRDAVLDRIIAELGGTDADARLLCLGAEALDAILEPVGVVDVRGNVVWENKTAEAIARILEPHPAGRRCWLDRVTHVDGRECRDCPVRIALRTLAPSSARTAEGDTEWLIHVYPRLSAGGRLLGAAVVCLRRSDFVPLWGAGRPSSEPRQSCARPCCDAEACAARPDGERQHLEGHGVAFRAAAVTLPRPAPPSSMLRGVAAATVLLADDDPALCAGFARLLGNLGCEVVVVADGRAAVEIFVEKPQRFDLVVLDLAMPRLWGDEALAEMLAVRPDLPAVLVTGSTHVEAFAECRARGFAAALAKPFDVAQLERALELALGTGWREGRRRTGVTGS